MQQMKEAVVSTISNPAADSINLFFLSFSSRNNDSHTKFCLYKAHLPQEKHEAKRPFSPPIWCVQSCADYRRCILLQVLVNLIVPVYNVICYILIVVIIRICSILEFKQQKNPTSSIQEWFKVMILQRMIEF